MTDPTFTIGADVRCKDKRCGRLEKLVVDPYSKRVTDLIVRRGRVLAKDRGIPVCAVAEVSSERIDPFIASDALESFPVYHTEAYQPLRSAGATTGTMGPNSSWNVCPPWRADTPSHWWPEPGIPSRKRYRRGEQWLAVAIR